MEKRMLRIVFILILAGGALFGVLLLHSKDKEDTLNPLGSVQKILSIEGMNESLRVTIADTAEKRVRGLSGHPVLAEDEGMLFLFDTAGKPAFWMKDMLFPIDIIWISSDWNIVDINENLDPSTYPATFSPQKDAQYVLEVQAGFAKRHSLKINQSLFLEK